MNLRLPADDVRALATQYAETIPVPEFDLRAVQSRRRDESGREPSRSAQKWTRRQAVAAAVVAGALLVIGTNVPGVVAQVQRIMQFFTIVNGQAIPLKVETVSLRQAQSDMPFEVIPPPSIRGNFPETIREIYSAPSRSDGHLMFEYPIAGQQFAVTIMETGANSAASSQPFYFTARDAGTATQRVVPPPPPTRQGPELITTRLPASGANVRFRFEPVNWTTRGTNITLVSPPGTLTADQMNAIREAMSH